MENSEEIASYKTASKLLDMKCTIWVPRTPKNRGWAVAPHAQHKKIEGPCPGHVKIGAGHLLSSLSR